jgi:hypothetical protein
LASLAFHTISGEPRSRNLERDGVLRSVAMAMVGRKTEAAIKMNRGAKARRASQDRNARQLVSNPGELMQLILDGLRVTTAEGVIHNRGAPGAPPVEKAGHRQLASNGC